MHYTIAIDGPSGAGKSSMANALAARLGIAHLDTGAMYRALALALIRDGVDPAVESEVVPRLGHYEMRLLFLEDGQHTLVNGQDLTPDLHSPQVSLGASDVSRYAAVRRWLVQLQRALAEEQSFILDGRDIGTVVLPDATAKFFLTASPQERAHRRYLDLQAAGEPTAESAVLADMQKRDAQDSGRQESPLRQAADALCIDSTGHSREEVLDLLLRHVAACGVVIP